MVIDEAETARRKELLLSKGRRIQKALFSQHAFCEAVMGRVTSDYNSGLIHSPDSPKARLIPVPPQRKPLLLWTSLTLAQAVRITRISVEL